MPKVNNPIKQRYPELGTNISLPETLLKMIFVFPRWDMLVLRRVTVYHMMFFVAIPNWCQKFAPSTVATKIILPICQENRSSNDPMCHCLLYQAGVSLVKSFQISFIFQATELPKRKFHDMFIPLMVQKSGKTHHLRER